MRLGGNVRNAALYQVPSNVPSMNCEEIYIGTNYLFKTLLLWLGNAYTMPTYHTIHIISPSSSRCAKQSI
jgi:hypothetical protein